MGICAMVECPACHKEFVVSPSMLRAPIEFHCPFCDLYFLKERSPRIVT